MTNFNYEKIKKQLEEKFGELISIITVTDGDSTYTGEMYGNDECFDIGHGFYQYLLTTEGVYKCYYDFDVNDEDSWENIDYDKADNIVLANLDAEGDLF